MTAGNDDHYRRRYLGPPFWKLRTREKIPPIHGLYRRRDQYTATLSPERALLRSLLHRRESTPQKGTRQRLSCPGLTFHAWFFSFYSGFYQLYLVLSWQNLVFAPLLAKTIKPTNHM